MLLFFFFFFFKQKTAYEIVDCDWSSDVCSSDLLYPSHIMDVLEMPLDADAPERVRQTIEATLRDLDPKAPVKNLVENCIAPMRLYEPLLNALVTPASQEIGRASCRERV